MLNYFQVPWPAAKRSYDLLHGVKLQFDNVQAFPAGDQGRNKRPASDAFDKERISDVLQREVFGPPSDESKATAEIGQSVGVQDLSTQLMAHILGLDVSGVVESTSYFPGYRWWPKSIQTEGGTRPQQQPPPLQSPPPPPSSAHPGSPDAWPMEGFGMEGGHSFNYEQQSMGGYQFGPTSAEVQQNGLFYNLQDLM
jgi:hypothetical protein